MKTAIENTLLCAWSPIAVTIIICCQFSAMFIDVTEYDDCTISLGDVGIQNNNSIFSQTIFSKTYLYPIQLGQLQHGKLNEHGS